SSSGLTHRLHRHDCRLVRAAGAVALAGADGADRRCGGLELLESALPIPLREQPGLHGVREARADRGRLRPTTLSERRGVHGMAPVGGALSTGVWLCEEPSPRA